MPIIDLDRFRFLTGHGKEFATIAEAALRRDVLRGDRLEPGYLAVHFDPAAGASKSEFFRHESDRIRGGISDVAGRPDYSMKGKDLQPIPFTLLSLVLHRGSRRDVVSLALNFILAGQRGRVEDLFQVYQHTFVTDSLGQRIPAPSKYIGVTSRSWLVRWREHVRDAKKGSPYLFHDAIRRFSDARMTNHAVLNVFATEKEAFDAEELAVASSTYRPMGLNMIPGGQAGVRVLHKLGAVNKGERVTADTKQDIIIRFFETTSRKGLPNPFAAENWNDPKYAESVICGGPDRLKPDQIREARYLKTIGQSLEEIAQEVGAKNVNQVRRLLDGETYSRVA